jgi:hypothetical protein
MCGRMSQVNPARSPLTSCGGLSDGTTSCLARRLMRSRWHAAVLSTAGPSVPRPDTINARKRPFRVARMTCSAPKPLSVC